MHISLQKAMGLIGCIALPFTIFAQQRYNLDFEQATGDVPKDWGIGQILDTGLPKEALAGTWHVDGKVKHNGKQSLCLDLSKATTEYVCSGYKIPVLPVGHKITLTGYIKTQDADSGAALWLRLDGPNGQNIDNMDHRLIKGTTNWQQYTIELNYNGQEERQILMGALLYGKGKLWVDDMHVYIDGNDLQNIDTANIDKSKFLPDDHSYTQNIHLTEDIITRLTKLGKLWAFIKYYHQAINDGHYNMDDELFSLLNPVIAAKDNTAFEQIISSWMDKLGTPYPCTHCLMLQRTGDTRMMPDNDFIKAFSPALQSKLNTILKNRDSVTSQYYVYLPPVGNPFFMNENNFAGVSYPDAGVRLLALYRYWAMVQYYYPYKYRLNDWNLKLQEYIPVFINAKNETDYVLACQRLVAAINDSHAILYNNTLLTPLPTDHYLPVQTRFINDTLVVTNVLPTAGTSPSANPLKKGDIILAINDTNAIAMANAMMPYISGSNRQDKLRDIAMGKLFWRHKDTKMKLQIMDSSNHIKTIEMPMVEVSELLRPKHSDETYKLLKDSIGYIKIGMLKNGDFENIKEWFKKTNALIFDFRGYPHIDVTHIYGAWLSSTRTLFSASSHNSATWPGLFHIENTGYLPENADTYKGKVIILVDETTQSAAEYAAMAFQASDIVTTIGTATAGADGNVSQIELPGGIKTMYSGIGIYYPNKSETQGNGIRIDKIVQQRAFSVREGRDDTLDAAIDIAEKK
ncbi:MAG: hypothetical protein BGO70_07210 [Bacteroidetes bacterium 43-93]|nr:hypothetical protein [Bacteroidota bacterium]OJW97568.1 MAG: hypothetical protein BGO70_07210 [Bacteroidetes bacterium 43-93]